jgi:nucleotide-binding universal stress UspA family protein
MLPIRTILHPTDFSDCSRHAGDFAAKVAKDYRALLVYLHVVESSISSPENTLGERSMKREKAEDELREIERSYPELQCDHIIVDGSAAPEIVRVSGEIEPDLIILGTHGRTGLRRVVMGSVAEEVIRRAPCPVLTIKPTDVPTVDYEDWIADAMATAERRDQQLDAMVDAELLSRSAHSSYAKSVMSRWLPLQKFTAAALCCRLAETPVPWKGLRSCEADHRRRDAHHRPSNCACRPEPANASVTARRREYLLLVDGKSRFGGSRARGPS